MSVLSAGGKPLPPCQWALPDPLKADPRSDVVAVGADLDPATVLSGYATGLFPMHLPADDPHEPDQLAWWSPNPRGILPLDGLHVSKSLRKSVKHFQVTFDAAFEQVMRSCQRGEEEGQWITQEFLDTYTELHNLGFAHSVEVWNRSGEIVGGLYGIELGGLFAGESMFHRERDASKVALIALVSKLQACGGERMLDVQWQTDHLASLGVIEISRAEYITNLQRVLTTTPCFT